MAVLLNKGPEVIRVLLTAGADAAAQDADGKRALDYTARDATLRDSDVYWLLNDASFR